MYIHLLKITYFSHFGVRDSTVQAARDWTNRAQCPSGQ